MLCLKWAGLAEQYYLSRPESNTNEHMGFTSKHVSGYGLMCAATKARPSNFALIILSACSLNEWLDACTVRRYVDICLKILLIYLRSILLIYLRSMWAS